MKKEALKKVSPEKEGRNIIVKDSDPGETGTKPSFLIITGQSGAGKTHAIRSLEDLEYFCVDNLPPSLLPKFAEICREAGGKMKKVAVVIDIRGGEFFKDLSQALQDMGRQGSTFEILFLEASTEVLVKRFKETRRRHPLSSEGRLLEDILLEKERLEYLRGLAHKIIDTSELTALELKNQLIDLYGPQNEKVRLNLTIMSFGYKYGIPLDADLVMDVRFLPNPYYQDNLRCLSGADAAVRDFVLQSDVTVEFLQRYKDLLVFLLPHYMKEGKTHLVVAIGCTGGQHRSVTLAITIGKMLAEQDYKVMVRHRDINKKGAGEERV